MGDEKHAWDKIAFDFLGGEVNVTNFTCSTTCTGLVPRAGHRLQIYEIMVSAGNITTTEGIGDVLFTDGA